MTEAITSVLQTSGSFRRGGRVIAAEYAPSSSQSGQDRDQTAHDDRSADAENVYFSRLASAPFVAQLAALYFGDAHRGERRVERDPAPVRARADSTYRAIGRLGSSIGTGFIDEVSY